MLRTTCTLLFLASIAVTQSQPLELLTSTLPNSGSFAPSRGVTATVASKGLTWSVNTNNFPLSLTPLFLLIGTPQAPKSAGIPNPCSAASNRLGVSGYSLALAINHRFSWTPPSSAALLGLQWSTQVGYVDVVNNCFGLGPTSFTVYSRTPFTYGYTSQGGQKWPTQGVSAERYAHGIVWPAVPYLRIEGNCPTGSLTCTGGTLYQVMKTSGYLQPLPKSGIGGLIYTIKDGTTNTMHQERAFVAAPVLAPLRRLMQLVQRDYGALGWQLRVTSALRMQDPSPGAKLVYLHSMARALDLQIVDANGVQPRDATGKLLDKGFHGELCNLAVEAGFQWVWNESQNNRVHVSADTGGPDITAVKVDGPTYSATAREYTWRVTATVSDPEGVAEVYAHVTSLGKTIGWVAGGLPPTVTTPAVDLSLPPVPLPSSQQVIVDVTVPESVLSAKGEATLHLWARDSFGSVKNATAGGSLARYPVTTERTIATDPYGMKFARIPAGTFTMGSPVSEPNRRWNETQHQVTISKDFYVMTTEVTQAQWQAVMGSNPSLFSGASLPVENVSWSDAQAFILKLNQLTGEAYRLPTESEWEYACRGGTASAYNSGSNSAAAGQLNPYAWYGVYYNSGSWIVGTSGGTTHAVGQKTPNAYGLYDMHGNVWEWCQDWHGSYPAGPVTDPQGPVSGSFRVFRGGCWSSFAQYCRSAFRFNFVPSSPYYSFGFRLLRSSH